MRSKQNKGDTLPNQYGRLVAPVSLEGEPEVLTRSEQTRNSRRFAVDLELSNHDVNCFECPKNGDCQLQSDAMAAGLFHTSFHGKRQPVGQIDHSNPFFDYDPAKCILCGRCSQVCHLRQGRNVLSLSGRGFATKMVAGYEGDFDSSMCESCGNCVSVCPTGALTSKVHQDYRKWETTQVKTTCPYCGTGCQISLVVKNRKIVDAEPANGVANKNLLCVKGKFASYKFVTSGDRLKKPLIKRDGEFVPVSWSEAINYMAERFGALKTQYGPDSLAGFACSRSTNEDNYVFQKMVRTAFGSNNVDNCARVCHAPSVHGLGITLGSGAMTNTIADITTDVDVILLIGSNTTEAHPVIGAQIRQAVQHGTKLIIIDPRNIDLVKNSTLHLQLKGGTNIALINAMMHVIIKEGLADEKFIAERTEGYEAMRDLVADYTPEKVAPICEVAPEDIVKAARMYALADKAPLIYCLGVTEHSFGTEGVMSMSNLAMLVGKVGRPGCGVNPLRGQNNVQGACDLGASPFDFPGYQKVGDPAVQAKFEEAWHTKLNDKIGLTETQALPAAQTGRIRGLYIFGEDPMATDPDTNDVRRDLENMDFLVVHDLFMTETAKYADVVLPGLSYAEKDGTFTNTERRVQRVRQAAKALGGVKVDYQVFSELATKMGYEMAYESPSAIMDEIAQVVPSYGGINYERLEQNSGLQWPCRTLDDPGTPILHVDKFTRGKGLFKALPYQPPDELPDDQYPFLMATGRQLYQYNTRVMTDKTPGIDQLAGRSYIEMNTIDAQKMGIKDGDKVQVSSRRGTIQTYAAVADVVSVGSVFMTLHFHDGNANVLTNPHCDDIAIIPDYKVCAVKIEPVATPVDSH
ncbi:MAG: formate dehydrogenase subunit alpha [Lactobacillus sp.]|jgi:formate dehydrogenase major subunit|nr:formate dehydrogenase subunit alpha [Lactobacillus sp.]